MPKSIWKLHANATSEHAANKIVNQCIESLNYFPITQNLEKYEKGGYMATVIFFHKDGSSWSDFVVEIIALGQRLGSGWSIYGNIYEESNAVLSKNVGNHIRIKGLDWAEWLVCKD